MRFKWPEILVLFLQDLRYRDVSKIWNESVSKLIIETTWHEFSMLRVVHREDHVWSRWGLCCGCTRLLGWATCFASGPKQSPWVITMNCSGEKGAPKIACFSPTIKGSLELYELSSAWRIFTRWKAHYPAWDTCRDEVCNWNKKGMLLNWMTCLSNKTLSNRTCS